MGVKLKLAVRLISVALTMIMVMQIVPMQVFAKSAENLKEKEQTQEIQAYENSEATEQKGKNEEIKAISEDENKREEYVKHFRMSDGTYQAAQYGVPVHFKDENNKWVDYDNSLFEIDTDDADNAKKIFKDKDFVNTRSDFAVRFSKKTNGKKFVRVEKNGYKLSWYYENANKRIGKATETKADDDLTTLEKTSSEIRYNDIYSNVDLQYIVNGNNIKENIILNSKNAETDFIVEYKIDGLTAYWVNEKAINLCNENNEVVFTIEAPYMIDDNGEYCEDISLEILSQQSNKLRVKINVNNEWIQAEERAFPVVVDPTIVAKQVKTTYRSTFVSSSQPDKRFLADTTDDRGSMYVGNFYPYGNTKSYIKFQGLPDLGGIASKVVDAKFAVYINRNETSDNIVDVYRIIEEWDFLNLSYKHQPKHYEAKSDYKYIPDYGLGVHPDKWAEFEITEMVQGWYEGTYENYGLMLSTDKTNACKTWLFSTDYSNYTYARPLLQISYRNMSGYEDYWSYTSMEAGYGGAASVNNYNGNLVVTQPLTQSVGGNLMPVNISAVYNSNKGVPDYSFLGSGWQTNYHLNIRKNPAAFAANASEVEKKYKYYFNDADGTKHYFYFNDFNDLTAKDEDGLGYTLKMEANNIYEFQDNFTATITDKDKNIMKFDWYGNVQEIIDSNGNKQIIAYEADGNIPRRIKTITDGAGREYVFKYLDNEGYHNYIKCITDPSNRIINFEYNYGMLLKVKFPDNTYIRYEYEDNYKMTKSTSLDWVYNEYQYDSTSQKRVNCMRKYLQNINGPKVESESYLFEYKQNETKVIDKQKRDYTYQFNDWGQTSGIVSNNDGKAQFFEYKNSGSGADNNANKLISSSKIQKSVTNYMVNPQLTRDISDGYAQYTEAQAGSYEIKRDAWNGHFGLGALQISKNANTMGRVFAMQDFWLSGGTYTLSAYVATGGGTLTGSGSAAAIQIWGNNGLEGVYTAESVNYTPPGEKTWERKSVTVTIPDGKKAVVVLGLDENATGTVWFDDIQLEKSEGESSFNLIENSGLTNGTANWSPEAGLSNCIDLNEFDKCMYINGDVTQQLVGLVQQIYNVSGKKGDVFSFGSWAKANSAPTDNQTKLGDSYQPAFQLALHYYDASGRWIQCTTTKANCDVGTWQFLSAKSIAPIDYSKIAIEIIYSHNINVLYGTGGYCYKEEYGQTYDYDKDGNVISTKDLAKTQSEFAYKGNQMAKMFNPSGSSYLYSYEYTNNNLLYANSTDGQQYSFNYDDKGNVLGSEIKEAKLASQIEDGKIYFIRNAYSGNVIDSGNSGQSSIVKNWRYVEGSPFQPWQAVKVSDNVFVLKSVYFGVNNGNLNLTNENGSNAENSNFVLSYDWKNETTQQFKIVKNSDGTFRILSGVTNFTKCIDGQPENSKDTNDNSAIKQCAFIDNDVSQKWYFFEQPSATSQRISTSSTYTPNKNFTASTTDQRGNSTLYSYDQTKGFLNETTDALGRKTSYTYNENNNALMSVSAGGMTNSYTYDMGERLSEINVNNAVKYKFEYDGFGKATKTQVGNGTTYKTLSELSYNPNNLLSNQTYGNGHSVRFSYDNLDRITKKMYNDDENKKITYAYNSDGNLASTSDYFTNTRTKYIYDLADRIVSQREYIGTNGSNQIKSSTDYAYADKTNYLTGVKHFSPLGTQNIGYRYGNISNGEMPDQIYGVTWNGKEKQNYTYDGLGRLTNKKIICHSEPVEASQQIVLNNQYTYEDVANSNKTTTLVKSVTNAVGTCTYTYDLVGNIKTISDGTYTTSYDYDALNQLVRENNQKENYTKTFEYSNGNIMSKKTYVYTLGTLSGAPTVETFAYGDAEWKDLLTSFNGKNITYDAIGNPTKIGTDVLSWQGRQLMSYGTNSYEYNADGQRTSKTVGGVKTEFFYNGSILAGQKCGNDTLIFMYDNNGDAFGFTYNSAEYYYIKNAQNDVIAVANANGTIVAKYTYDAWGKVIDSEDLNLLPNSILISEINPIRYRSYYYDSELYIYYLNTRYYSPIMCRFLNADDTNVLDADQDSLVENNLFAYCLNNPVNHNDSDGKIARTLKRGLALGIFAVGFAVGWKVAAVATVVVGIAVVIGATVSYYKEHVSTKNGKKKNKHQKGKARRNRDQGGEKKKRNSGWKRPR